MNLVWIYFFCMNRTWPFGLSYDLHVSLHHLSTVQNVWRCRCLLDQTCGNNNVLDSNALGIQIYFPLRAKRVLDGFLGPFVIKTIPTTNGFEWGRWVGARVVFCGCKRVSIAIPTWKTKMVPWLPLSSWISLQRNRKLFLFLPLIFTYLYLVYT